MQKPSIGFIQSLGTGFTASTIKPGAVVSFTAVEQLSPNSWIIQIQGQKLKVQSSISLALGEHLRARVILQEGKMLLKLLDSGSPVKSLADRLGLPRSEASGQIIRSFVEQGLPLREEMLRGALLLYEQVKNRDPRSARLIALLFDKGIFVNAKQFEKFQQLLWETPNSHPESLEERRKKGRDSQHDEERQNEKRRRQQEKDRLSKVIRRQIHRKGNEGSLLQLFNHMEAAHDNWIVVPLEFHSQSVPDAPGKGVLRLHTGPDGMADMCTCTIFGTREWHFRLKLREGKKLVRLSVEPLPNKRESREIVFKLREKLSNLSFEIDDTISEVVKFSHYDSENKPDIKNIDTFV